ncbi:NAD(P)-dependent dehydrogenase (short-subunit alcohol dehydrogenase family) [Streptosporangium becharense]|uniref:NAD(P)-dependent dehydrogenase (Short-subunit alcohol dehydrogenase family) n=1 Tax=Streptosporangium becharense TaxID=1816182 RepID=A0A7W9MGQ7_9ACTN|nr:SDR family oxidoreductase [Streptosporangium becharense]MBB2908892.1 NAD(P)-dependent dehydrogenase (short-subunit alcohol dehydrogenase family) [Streptosporangium becharense]MBB5820090.1 NAD(P)-dependent dehydrogenase (short-subunit alcohol dehydrogenase family) [Streptosporangium becharense]
MITVITGASAGIGEAAAVELARRGQQVVLVGRNPEKLDRVAERVRGAAGARPATFTCDYTSLDDVRRLAADLRDRYERIDVLVNNAGVMTTERKLTRDGHETMIQVNHLAPFLLTNLLLDRVGSRVITTSSRAGKTGRLDPSDLDRERRRWSGWLQYGDSKQAGALFTVELARRLAGTGVTATCFHPGVIKTEFAPSTFVMWMVKNIPGMGQTVEQGASTLVHLATHPDGAAHPGRYFAGSAPASVPKGMSDPELARVLWEASEAAVA